MNTSNLQTSLLVNIKLNSLKKTTILWLLSVIFILVIFCFIVYFSWFFRNYTENAEFLFGEENKFNGEFAKFLATIIVGLLGFITIWLNYRRTSAMQMQTQNQIKQIEIQGLQIDKITEQNELIRKGKIDDRFKNAIEHLGSEKPAIALGGIHTLHRLTEEEDSYCPVVFDILCSFMREKSFQIKRFSQYSKKQWKSVKIQVEFQTIIELLFRKGDSTGCNYSHFAANLNGVKCYKADFSNVQLFYPKIIDAQLVGSNFSKATFEHSELCRTNMRNSNFNFSRFDYSDFSSVNLRKSEMMGVIIRSCSFQFAKFHEVNLQGAFIIDTDLNNVHFEGSNLNDVHFEGSNLKNTHFEGTRLFRFHFEMLELENAHFEGADLRGAHFEGAYLKGAHFEGADLKGSHFEGAYLKGTHFEGADLTDANFEGSYSTNWTGNDLILNFQKRVNCGTELKNINQGNLTSELIDLLELRIAKENVSKEFVEMFKVTLYNSNGRVTNICADTIPEILTQEKAESIIEKTLKRYQEKNLV